MVVYTGIIEFCKTPEELTSVMAHEMAHIEGMHVSKKMTKEIGLSLLTSIASGDAGNAILRDVIKTLSSTAFDRDMERNADSVAVRYLAKSNIDPEHFADMLYRLSKKTDVPEVLEWVSTHPDTKERTAEILKLRKKYKFQSKPLLSDEAWKEIQQKVKKEVQE
jgi:beta-barrel assembly-enhancing protease